MSVVSSLKSSLVSSLVSSVSSSVLGFSGGDVPFIPAKFTIHGFGQSLEAYKSTRGTPRVAVKYCEWLAENLGYTPLASYATYIGGLPYVTNDAGSKTGTNYTVRFVNSGSGGANLIDVSTPANIATGNYFWNTQDNSATSPDGVLDAVPNTGGPLWRAAMAALAAYGADAAEWSQGQSDSGWITLSGANETLYETVFRGFIAAVRAQVGKSNLPFIIDHMCRNNTYTDSSIQTIADIQTKVALDTSNVYIGVEEYLSQWAVVSAVVGCSTISGDPKIYTTDTSAFTVPRGVEGPNIPINSYVLSVNDGVSVTLNKNATATGSGLTMLVFDGTHPSPSSLAGYDTDINEGFYNICKRQASVMSDMILRSPRKSFCPYVSAVTAYTGETVVDLTVTHYLGSDLTTLDGAISSKCTNLFRLENNGSPMTITDVARLDGATIRLTTSTPLAAGDLDVWVVYGAMNKSYYKDFIIDNATVAMPLLRQDPVNYPYLSVTVAAYPRSDMQTAGFSNVVAQWDATLSASYSGSGSTLANIIPTPADGELEASYDLTMTGLTFTGSAGDEAAYLLTAGAGYAEIAANTAFLKNLGKTAGQDHTVIMVYEPADVTSMYIYSLQNTTSTQGTSASSAATVTYRQRGDTTNSNIVGDSAVVAGVRHIVIMTHNHTTGKSRVYVNERTAVEKTHVYDATTTDPSGNLHIFSRSDVAGFMPSGSKFVGGVLMNTYIGDTEAGAIIDYFNALHGVTYA